jgi:hypothetical protein
VVQDSERRAFNELKSFTLDIDGDDKPDTITPRTYTVKTNRKIFNGDEWKALELHWIAFDIKTGQGRALNSFFKYHYGNNVDDYYVFAFVPAPSIETENPTFCFMPATTSTMKW